MEQVKHTPTKFWKPNFLIFVNDCGTGMLAMCNTLKKGGLMVVGQVRSSAPWGQGTQLGIPPSSRVAWLTPVPPSSTLKVVPGELQESGATAQKLREAWADYMRQMRFKSFVHTTAARHVREAYQVQPRLAAFARHTRRRSRLATPALIPSFPSTAPACFPPFPPFPLFLPCPRSS